jgi:hypothetical protein
MRNEAIRDTEIRLDWCQGNVRYRLTALSVLEVRTGPLGGNVLQYLYFMSSLLSTTRNVWPFRAPVATELHR